MQIEKRRGRELTANPNADALCLMNDTAVERERGGLFTSYKSLLLFSYTNMHMLAHVIQHMHDQ